MPRIPHRPALGLAPRAIALCLSVLAACSAASAEKHHAALDLLATATGMLAVGAFGDALRIASNGAEEARASLDPMLQRERLSLLLVASQAADALRLDQIAFRLHQDAVATAQRLAGRDTPLRPADLHRLLQAWASLAESLRARGNHSAALRAVAKSQQSLVALEQLHGRQLQDLRAAVGLLASDAADCAGDALAALAHFEAATPGGQLHWPPTDAGDALARGNSRRRPASALSRHLALLGRAAAARRAEGKPGDAAALWEQWAQVAAAGVASGAIPSVWQAPGSWRRGLLSRPWHSFGPWSGWKLASTRQAFARIQDVLIAAAPALREEWVSIRNGESASRQAECLHYLSDPLDAPKQPGHIDAPPVPEWRQYSASGFWHDERLGRSDTVESAALLDWAARLARVPADRIRVPWRCSRGSPVLCAVTAAISAVAEATTRHDLVSQAAGASEAIQVLRTGYSELGPRTSLRAHHGRSNGQLKMHLGIAVPSPTAAEQRALRRRAALAPPSQPSSPKCGRSSCVLAGDNKSSLCWTSPSSCERQPIATADPWSTGLVSASHCAALRVTGPDDAFPEQRNVESRWKPWENGRVIFFDDSFLHEVANVCSQPRAVVQVVLKHPWLPAHRAEEMEP
uniref:Aspartyl/asparaginy/proline hydroxylase domain-containing protein n=1 Tax=Cafeteria roenbergensis TaxID=33653 RepID=A0A7S0PI99_CAFRO